jgi:hypothetical protein
MSESVDVRTATTSPESALPGTIVLQLVLPRRQ